MYAAVVKKGENICVLLCDTHKYKFTCQMTICEGCPLILNIQYNTCSLT